MLTLVDVMIRGRQMELQLECGKITPNKYAELEEVPITYKLRVKSKETVENWERYSHLGDDKTNRMTGSHQINMRSQKGSLYCKSCKLNRKELLRIEGDPHTRRKPCTNYPPRSRFDLADKKRLLDEVLAYDLEDLVLLQCFLWDVEKKVVRVDNTLGNDNFTAQDENPADRKLDTIALLLRLEEIEGSWRRSAW